jgi:hypothetical protein
MDRHATSPLPSNPISSPSAAASSSTDPGEMNQLLSMLLEMKEELRESRLERSQLVEQNSALSKELKSVTRRQSRMFYPSTPLASIPKVSSMTHSVYANLNTPSVKAHHSTRLSVGNAGGIREEQKKDGYERVDDDDVDSEEEEPQQERRATVPPPKVDHDKEMAKLAKVMTKIKTPVVFSGETTRRGRTWRHGWRTSTTTSWPSSVSSQATTLSISGRSCGRC